MLFNSYKADQVKIKICGLARVEDVRKAQQIGIHALGFLLGNSNGKTPTDKLTPQAATALMRDVIPPTVSVLLVRNETSEEIVRLVDELSPACVQLQSHAITIDAIKALTRTYPIIEFIKTIKIYPNDSADLVFARVKPFIQVAHAILLDSANGGSGISHDWNISAEVAKRIHEQHKPVILAGGLKPNNILNAVDTVRPDMVDIMSGASVEKGVKDFAAIIEIFQILNDRVPINGN